MTRQQEALQLATEVMADFELSRTTTVQRLLKTQRVARLIDDTEAQQWLGYELNGVPDDEAGARWMTRVGRWTEPDEGKGFFARLSELEAVRVSSERTAAALGGAVSLSGDMVYVAMRDRTAAITNNEANASKMARVAGAVDSEIYRYVSDVHVNLTYSELQADLFASARGVVDARLAAVAGDALSKIDSIAERLGGGDAEAVSQAMSTCRRLIDSVADHVFPGQDEPYIIGHQPLQVKTSHVLNRLNAHLHRCGVAGGRATRLRRTLSDLYDRVSSGVHAEVSRDEASYLFLSTYVVLGEVLTIGTPEE